MVITNGKIPQLEHRSAIDVLIVGAGVGALFTAIEMQNNGHDVRVVESKESLDVVGE